VGRQIEVNVVVRKATLEDTEVLACLIRSSFRDVAERFDLDRKNAPTHPSNCQPDWIRSDLARGVAYYLVCWRGSAAGCVALEFASPSLAYLERLGVAPEHRGRGFGARLVRHALQQARSAGAGVVSAGVIAEHTELISWYERLGFTQAETRRFPHLPFTVSYLEHVLS
jgi:ribosomal protein S18 acetylase RimI-like enzyme